MGWKGIAWFAARPRLRAALAWAAVLIAAAVAFYLAWIGYDEPGRPDGTVGHIYIDFSGQWIMGRMLARGEGPYLYDRERVGEALRQAYGRRDGETALGWIIEAPDRPGVGGPLYPPIQALFFYPLGTAAAADRPTGSSRSVNLFVDFCHRLSRLGADARPRLARGGRRSGDGVSGLRRRHLPGPERAHQPGAAGVRLAADGPRPAVAGRDCMGSAGVQAGVGRVLFPGPAADAPLADGRRHAAHRAGAGLADVAVRGMADVDGLADGRPGGVGPLRDGRDVDLPQPRFAGHPPALSARLHRGRRRDQSGSAAAEPPRNRIVVSGGGPDRVVGPMALAAAGRGGRAGRGVPDAGRLARLLSLHVLRHAPGGAAGLSAVYGAAPVVAPEPCPGGAAGSTDRPSPCGRRHRLPPNRRAADVPFAAVRHVLSTSPFGRGAAGIGSGSVHTIRRSHGDVRTRNAPARTYHSSSQKMVRQRRHWPS